VSELTPSNRYFNRELSDLDFITRVLEEADNTLHPLLERLRFLAISADVLDQFHTVRSAKLRRSVEREEAWLSIDGLTPVQQLDAIMAKSQVLSRHMQETLESLRLQLRNQYEIQIVGAYELSKADETALRQHFEKHVVHILTPFAVDQEHPFPFIPSGGICAILEFDEDHILIPLPANLPRFMPIPGDDDHHRYVTFETMLFLCWDIMFPHKQITSQGLFQILRDNDLALAERFDDLKQMVESSLTTRHKANVSLLKVNPGMSEEARLFVTQCLGMLSDDEEALANTDQFDTSQSATVSEEMFLAIGHIGSLISKHLGPAHPNLLFPPYHPRMPQRILDFEHDCFSAIRAKDLLVHWPFETFDVVVAFLDQAAKDPGVLSIKQTLYRTSDESPIVEALVMAARAGKAVTAVIELEARDNEASNIEMASRLEAAGAQIVYGIIGLKVHCKSTLVVRREEDETRLYAHFGTGNYHPGNARTYTDLSFFTCDDQLTRDAASVYNYLTSNIHVPTQKLRISPKDLRTTVHGLIDQEITNAKAGLPAQIWAKINSLTDPRLTEKLYEASNAGVQIDLIIRRHCILKPGVPGMSENIRVKSIVGRLLEHSRIYCFANGATLPSAQAKVFMASADWMTRNLDERVEIMVPIENETVHRQILEQIMGGNIRDERQAWHLNSAGEYIRDTNTSGFCSQSYFMEQHSYSGLGSKKNEISIPDPLSI